MCSDESSPAEWVRLQTFPPISVFKCNLAMFRSPRGLLLSQAESFVLFGRPATLTAENRDVSGFLQTCFCLCWTGKEDKCVLSIKSWWEQEGLTRSSGTAPREVIDIKSMVRLWGKLSPFLPGKLNQIQFVWTTVLAGRKGSKTMWKSYQQQERSHSNRQETNTLRWLRWCFWAFWTPENLIRIHHPHLEKTEQERTFTGARNSQRTPGKAQRFCC